MQPLKQLSQTLRSLADREHCVFSASDLGAAVPECGHRPGLLSRATKAGLLKRVCRGIYLYPVPDYPTGHLLFHAAARLRACYGSPRLSEDLDFTGGSHFQHGDLAELGSILTERLRTRYDLPVRVSKPVKTGGNVSTWKLVIETRPGQKHLPAQRIHLDICAIPSHDPHPMMLRMLYGIDLGTSGLILHAQSREEILADKVIAVAFQQNRIKNRDL